MTVSVGLDCRVKRALLSVAVTAGLLWLDGQLGPISFTLRRVTAATLLAIVTLGVVRPKGRLASTLASWAAVALVAVAPTIPMALLAYIFAVTMVGVNDASETSPLAPGLPQTCLTYVGIRFLSDLLPQSRVLGEALSAAAHGYLRVATGTDQHLSPTALGGPAIVIAVVYLLWRWRLSGSWRRLLGTVVVPVAWFLLLASLALPASAGPIAIFARGACYGAFWITCAALVDAVAPWTADVACSVAGRAMPRSLLISACAASLLIGTTLVGVVFPGIPTQRSILVHNRGAWTGIDPCSGNSDRSAAGCLAYFPFTPALMATGSKFSTRTRSSRKIYRVFKPWC